MLLLVICYTNIYRDPELVSERAGESERKSLAEEAERVLEESR